MTRRKPKTIADLAADFQAKMQESGLAVTISTDNMSVKVTSYCESCKHVAKGSPELCPACGKEMGEALPGPSDGVRSGQTLLLSAPGDLPHDPPLNEDGC